MAAEDDERRTWFRREVLPLQAWLRVRAGRFCRDNSNEADDLIHETFARLIAFKGWREIENVPGFALRTMQNLALESFRRRKIVPIVSMPDIEQLEHADDYPGAERQMEARDELRLLTQMMSELPPQCARVFTLCKVYGMSHKQIADRLGLSIHTVEKHVTKGLRLCSERLDRHPRRSPQSDVTAKKAARWDEIG